VQLLNLQCVNNILRQLQLTDQLVSLQHNGRMTPEGLVLSTRPNRSGSSRVSAKKTLQLPEMHDKITIKYKYRSGKKKNNCARASLL